jgi:glycolate oxidase FAD binding subunit
MIQERTDLRELFEPIVGAAHIREAVPADAVDGLQPQLIVAPGSAKEVAHVLRAADDAGVHLIPRGSGTKLAWGNVPRQAEMALSTERLSQLVEHAHGDMTATAEAGITISTLQTRLAQHGQMLALDPAWPEHATLGGVIAADASGPLRVRYGTMRDLLIGIEVALPDGTLAKGGGKVVKNVAGYDLMKLFTGSLGTLGVITAATLRLHPLPAAILSLYVRTPTAAVAQQLVLDLNASTLTPTGVQVVSADQEYGVCVRFMGVEASVRAQSAELVQRVAAAGLAAHALDEAGSHAAWHAHARIYADSDKPDNQAIVARFSVLPAALASALDMIAMVAGRLRLSSRVVAQATGTGILRFEGENDQALLAAVGTVRTQVLEQGGYLAIQRIGPEHKAQLDVFWEPPGAALALMRRVKQQFDPNEILSPGRFIGRI